MKSEGEGKYDAVLNANHAVEVTCSYGFEGALVPLMGLTVLANETQ